MLTGGDGNLVLLVTVPTDNSAAKHDGHVQLHGDRHLTTNESFNATDPGRPSVTFNHLRSASPARD